MLLHQCEPIRGSPDWSHVAVECLLISHLRCKGASWSYQLLDVGRGVVESTLFPRTASATAKVSTHCHCTIMVPTHIVLCREYSHIVIINTQ